MLNSVEFVPPRVPWPIPVKVTLPVLVRVKTWVGAENTPTPRVAVPKLCDGGVKLALVTAATPVPDKATGEPLTVTLAVMVAVPVEEVTPVPGE
jgi:hypothetical protein